MDYSKHLVLYSGGADSTFFIEQEPTARHLLHYSDMNSEQTRIATINSHLLGRYLTVIPAQAGRSLNGGMRMSSLQILDDSEMVFNASLMAVKMGLKGVVVCFNADDTGIDTKSIESVIRKAEPEFEILLPLNDVNAKTIRERLKNKSDGGIRYTSCMHSTNCGFCPKCKEQHMPNKAIDSDKKQPRFARPFLARHGRRCANSEFMSIKQKDIKLLWGRAAERCSFPGCGLKLSQDKNATTETFPLGEQAHIVGKEEGSARSHSILTVEERDSYYNTILLCPTHHTLIDNNPEDYPIEKLHLIKSQHEYWVESTLSESQNRNIKTNDIIYAHLVDLAVEGCSFSYWGNWISSLYGPSHRIKQSTYDKAIDYTLKMYKAVWPGTLIELEAAMKTFSRTMNMMLNFYMNNAESKADYYIEDRLYKRQWHSEEVFAELV